MEKGKVLLVWIFCMMMAALPALWMPTSSSAAKDVEKSQSRGKEEFGPLKALSKLDLTQAQKHDVAVILKKNRDTVRGLISQMSDARKNLFAAMSAPEYSEGAVKDAAHEVGRIQEELLVLRAQIFQQVRAVMTPEQQAKLSTMRARFGKKMHERMDKRFERLDKWIDAHSD